MRDDDTADDDHGTADGADDVDETVIRPRAGAPVGDDVLGDTVIRPRQGAHVGGDVLGDGVHRPRADAHLGDDPLGDDLLGDTVIRPRLRPGANPAADTLIRPRPEPVDDPLGDTVIRSRGDATSVPTTATGAPVAAGAGGPTGGADASTDDTVLRDPTRPDTDRGPRTRHAPSLQADAPQRTRTPSVRIGDHVLRLDRPVVVGRRPALPRVVRGPEPLLVTVHSASGQVSSSHLLLQASGEAAVVEDLRSTNGTVIRPVAGRPFRLASGGSAVVLTGTVVEIGDGNAVEILSPHLRVPPADPVPTPPDRP